MKLPWLFRAYRADPRHRDVFGDAGVTQAQLGLWLGLTQAQVSRIESGQQPCRQLDVLIGWARVLGVPRELLWFDVPDAEDDDTEADSGPDSLSGRPTLLKELLRSRYLLPYRRFRQEYDKVAKRLGKELVGTCPSDRTYKRWLSGRISGQPRSECCSVLEAMFPGFTVAEILAEPGSKHQFGKEYGDELGISEHDSALSILDRKVSLIAADTYRSDAVRDASTVQNSQGVEATLMVAADESSQFLAWAEAGNVGELTIDQIHGEIRCIASSYLKVPTLPLFERTHKVRDRVFALLAGHQKPSQTRDLYSAAGWSLTMLA